MSSLSDLVLSNFNLTLRRVLPSGYFSADEHNCDQFLRHKSFAVSPMKLQNDALRPNVLVQHENEFVFTFPRGESRRSLLSPVSSFVADLFDRSSQVITLVSTWTSIVPRASTSQSIPGSSSVDEPGFASVSRTGSFQLLPSGCSSHL